LQYSSNSTNNSWLILTVAIFGLVIIASAPTQVTAQKDTRINWYELCKNPIVDLAIAEPCNELTTNGGYTLTPQGERVLACLGGGAAAILAGMPQLIQYKNEVGCGAGTPSSSSSSYSSLENSRESDPIGNILTGLLG
jgi:hypothetical protein